MTYQKLREAYDTEPFQPFEIHLADGRSIPVHHREFFASATNSRVVVVFQPEGSMNIIDLELVTDLEIKSLRKSKSRRR